MGNEVLIYAWLAVGVCLLLGILAIAVGTALGGVAGLAIAALCLILLLAYLEWRAKE